MEGDDMPRSLCLAAVTPLSACALRSITASKAAALRVHLHTNAVKIHPAGSSLRLPLSSFLSRSRTPRSSHTRSAYAAPDDTRFGQRLPAVDFRSARHRIL